MKLTVIQMALGVLVVLSACYIVGWMIFGIPSLLTMPVPDESGIMSYTDIVPKNELLFTTARYASGLLLGLSLTALVVGTAQFVKAGERKQKLAVVQMVSGALIAATSILIMGWGYPTEFIIPVPEGIDISRGVAINLGPPMTYAVLLTYLTLVLGLVVLVLGIAQFMKARR